jgi:hypothetical protein
MNRYNNGKIYKIVDNTNGNVYIGSTCEPTLARRLAGHRGAYNSYLNGGRVDKTSSFNILENNNCSIVLLEDYPCERKDQLLARERFYIENNQCVNKVIPTRTIKEYYQDNKDKLIDYQKEYYEQNKDKLKEYYEQNKDKIKEYREQNKDKIIDYQKEYYEQNKDKLKEYYEQNKDKIKEYYEQNKDKINEHRYKHFTCECGGCYIQKNKATHLKSIKHQNYLNNKNEN